MSRLRLLPPGHDLGFTPYAWLVYLVALLVEPLARGATPTEWAALAVAMAVFLPAYFAGYWGGRGLAAGVLVPLLLGAGLAFVNPGALVLFAYASSFAGQVERPRVALLAIAGVTAAAALLSRAGGAPAWVSVGALLFVPLMGFVNLHFARERRANARLRRARAEVEYLAAVAERERIARDLHDVLGHTLSLVVVKAQLAARLADRDAARAAGEMRDVERVARAALAEVRETIRGYHPRLADEVARAGVLLDTAGVRADLALEDAARLGLDGAREEALALALREAVTNVVRHADARHCTTRLSAVDGAVVLVVEDDGRGMLGAPEGGGLRGMRDRVEVLGGGVLHVPRAGGRGRRVEVRMPLDAVDAPRVDCAPDPATAAALPRAPEGCCA